MHMRARAEDSIAAVEEGRRQLQQRLMAAKAARAERRRQLEHSNAVLTEKRMEAEASLRLAELAEKPVS